MPKILVVLAVVCGVLIARSASGEPKPSTNRASATNVSPDAATESKNSRQARSVVEKAIEALPLAASESARWQRLDLLEQELRKLFEAEPEEQTIGTDQEPSAAQIFFTFEEVFAATREPGFRDSPQQRREICEGLSTRIAFPLRSTRPDSREVTITWHEARAQQVARIICGKFPTQAAPKK